MGCYDNRQTLLTICLRDTAETNVLQSIWTQKRTEHNYNTPIAIRNILANLRNGVIALQWETRVRHAQHAVV